MVPEAQEISTGDTWNTTYADYLDWRAASRTLRLAAYQESSHSVAEGDRPEQLDGVRTTADLFAVIGIAPLRGRTIATDEEALGVQLVEVVPTGELGTYHGAGGGPDHGVGGGEVGAAVAHSLEHAEHPGDPGDAAAAEDQRSVRRSLARGVHGRTT